MRLIYFDEVDSTQDMALKYYLEGYGEGTVILAKKQRKGRGRNGRFWYSPEGGLWLSIILQPNLEDLSLLPLLASKALKDLLEERFSLKLKIKYPNDLYYEEKKLAGFLLESSFKGDRLEYCILGVGINVNNPVPEGAISLKEIVNRELELKDLTEAYLKKFFELYYKGLEVLLGEEIWYKGKNYKIKDLSFFKSL
ncbi:Bifunctional ligase/repressor BirA [archaeon HR06]|nr:Bifunctional ligase/repressor BirA [archaeon HR06]